MGASHSTWIDDHQNHTNVTTIFHTNLTKSGEIFFIFLFAFFVLNLLIGMICVIRTFFYHPMSDTIDPLVYMNTVRQNSTTSLRQSFLRSRLSYDERFIRRSQSEQLIIPKVTSDESFIEVTPHDVIRATHNSLSFSQRHRRDHVNSGTNLIPNTEGEISTTQNYQCGGGLSQGASSPILIGSDVSSSRCSLKLPNKKKAASFFDGDEVREETTVVQVHTDELQPNSWPSSAPAFKFCLLEESIEEDDS